RGRALARAYELVVFPGHHEYVTTREYDVVTGYRNLGGHLMFLSANNFFWQVVRHGRTIERTKQWRDLGRPEAALIGVQYRGNDNGTHRGAWIVRRSKADSWVFANTKLGPGSELSNAGRAAGSRPRGGVLRPAELRPRRSRPARRARPGERPHRPALPGRPRRRGPDAGTAGRRHAARGGAVAPHPSARRLAERPLLRAPLRVRAERLRPLRAAAAPTRRAPRRDRAAD